MHRHGPDRLRIGRPLEMDHGVVTLIRASRPRPGDRRDGVTFAFQPYVKPLARLRRTAVRHLNDVARWNGGNRGLEADTGAERAFRAKVESMAGVVMVRAIPRRSSDQLSKTWREWPST